MRYIFKGTEISPQMSFEHYGIQDGDPMIVLPIDGGCDIRSCSACIAATRDEDDLKETLKWMLDPRTGPEVARLRDIEVYRAEGRPKCHRARQFTFGPVIGRTHRPLQTKIDYQEACAPTTEALPVIWSSEAN
jgi:hypothetical protein